MPAKPAHDKATSLTQTERCVADIAALYHIRDGDSTIQFLAANPELQPLLVEIRE